MIYGKAKERDMIRSVLPSTRRRSARFDLATTKRRSRREIRQSMRLITIDTEVWDDRPDVYDYPYARIGEIRNERRDGDNVRALQRWAPAQVVGIRPLDALSKMKGLLPNNVIGRHALTHIDDLPAFTIGKADDYTYGPTSFRYNRQRQYFFDHDRVREELALILRTPGAHYRLNGYLIRRYPVGYRAKYIWTEGGKLRKVPTKQFEVAWQNRGRSLMGPHDVDAFINHYEHYYHDLRLALDKTLARVPHRG